MAKVKGHKRGCKCAICSRGRKGAKKSAKKGAKKSAARKPAHHHAGASLEAQYKKGFADGAADVKHKRPMRKATGKRDQYAAGYRAGAKVARLEAKKRR